MVLRLTENTFAGKNTLRHFYSLPQRQNFPPGSNHHSQISREITHPPSRQQFFNLLWQS